MCQCEGINETLLSYGSSDQSHAFCFKHYPMEFSHFSLKVPVVIKAFRLFLPFLKHIFAAAKIDNQTNEDIARPAGTMDRHPLVIKALKDRHRNRVCTAILRHAHGQ